MSPARLLLALALALGGCTPSARAAADGPTVQAAHARVLPNGVGAAYLTLVNPAAEADTLTGISSPHARGVELHEVVEERGLLRMVPHPEGFAVPARGRLQLAEGGKHVMLYGVQLPAGARAVPLTLHLRRAGALQVQAPLRAPGAEVGEALP